MSKSKLIAQTWTNSIGQTINPGDKVLSIATGYSHSTKVREGVFLGTVNGNPSVTVKDSKYGYWVDGKDVGYRNGVKQGIKGQWQPYSRRSTLPSKRVYKLA
jgi:hypothetical protein